MTAVSQPAGIEIFGTTASIVVTDPTRQTLAEEILRVETAAIDQACSRFRDDSELRVLSARPGRASGLSPLLTGLLGGALRVARATGGLVDPTVGAAVRGLGYDRDFAAVPTDRTQATVRPRPAPGWWQIRLDADRREVVIPAGVEVDLGATAKAYAADRIAARVAAEARCGVLVDLGGDIAVAGDAPAGGWLVGVDDGPPHGVGATIAMWSGGLATSSVLRRRWRMAGRELHHIVDPRTGDLPAPVWGNVSVAADSCLDANAASTAAIVLGEAAPGWLETRGLPARLRSLAGHCLSVADWPDGRS
ncbi:FAD:protein FMN transferase [Fodinicola acaciae]|uniref:FAD:protein FMN transferase n=1 Tax=Fodinicola acaciae TaxID=2681555 RepID=UPI0013D84602|nr:FAD:protein FMN transferase [Fodinicola acaciae]